MKMKEIDILVVEDQEHHLQDIKCMIEQRQQKGVNLKVNYVTNLEEAYGGMSQAKGIISDIFFPDNENTQPKNQAYKMVDKAEAQKIPIVLCTDGDHHGPHLQEVTDNLGLASEGMYIRMVDYAVMDDKRLTDVIESRMKNWPRAYHCLMSGLVLRRPYYIYAKRAW